MDFPQMIRNVRESLNETQDEFAKRFGSHANTVSRWESGQYQAPYEVIAFVLEPSNGKPKTIDVIWGNEPGFRFEVIAGKHGRVYFTIHDGPHNTRFSISLERHNVQRLAEELLKHGSSIEGGERK